MRGLWVMVKHQAWRDGWAWPKSNVCPKPQALYPHRLELTSHAVQVPEWKRRREGSECCTRNRTALCEITCSSQLFQFVSRWGRGFPLPSFLWLVCLTEERRQKQLGVTEMRSDVQQKVSDQIHTGDVAVHGHCPRPPGHQANPCRCFNVAVLWTMCKSCTESLQNCRRSSERRIYIYKNMYHFACLSLASP